MNKTVLVIVSLIVACGLTLPGCTTGTSLDKAGTQSTQANNSADYHQATIQHLGGHALVLGRKIQELQQQVKAYSQKPYRDPKGFRRGGWKLLIGSWKQELNNLHEQIAWHTNELLRIKENAGMRGMDNGDQVQRS